MSSSCSRSRYPRWVALGRSIHYPALVGRLFLRWSASAAHARQFNPRKHGALIARSAPCCFPAPEIPAYMESTHPNNVYESATYLNICSAFDPAGSNASLRRAPCPGERLTICYPIGDIDGGRTLRPCAPSRARIGRWIPCGWHSHLRIDTIPMRIPDCSLG